MTTGPYRRVPRFPFTLLLLLAATVLGPSLTFSVSAAPPADPQPPGLTPEQVVKELAPVLLPETLAVIAVDVAAVDPAAQAAWLEKVWEPQAEPLQMPVESIQQMREGFLAAGAERLYMILPARSIESRLVAVAPAEGVDAQAIEKLLGWHGSATRRVGDVLVVGLEADLAHLPVVGVEQARALTQALALVEPAPLLAALIPPAYVRQILEQTLAEEGLPGIFKGRPVTDLTQTLRLAAAAIRPAPDPQLQLVVQAENPQAAQRLQENIVQPFLAEMAEDLTKYQDLLADEADLPEAERAERRKAHVNQIVTLLTPERREDRLVLEPNEKDMIAVTARLLATSRAGAARTRELTHARGIQQALFLYNDQHKQSAPDLAELVIQKYFPPSYPLEFPTDTRAPAEFNDWPVGRRRQWVQEHSQFIYLRPDQPLDKLDRPSDTIVILERRPEGGTVAAAFADGHAQFLSEQEVDQRLRQQTGRSYKEWQEQAAPPAAVGEDQDQEQEEPPQQPPPQP